MLNLNGTATFTRSSEGTWHFRVLDVLSGCEVVEVALDNAAFADLMAGRGRTPCTFDFNVSGKVGMRREHKILAVFVPTFPWGNDAASRRKRRKIIALAMIPHESGGWQARITDAENHHNHAGPEHEHEGVKGCFVRIVFERWVDADPEPPPQPTEEPHA
jgi:hypothetical protein